MSTLNQWQHYARVRDWATARDWILGGRNKINRPLYDSNASVAFVDPTDTNSDIVINWRYAHINPNYYTVHDYIVKYHKDDRTATISPSAGMYPSCRRIMKRYANLVDIRWVGKEGRFIIKQPDDPLITTKGLRICSCCTGCGITSTMIGPFNTEDDAVSFQLHAGDLLSDVESGQEFEIHELYTPQDWAFQNLDEEVATTTAI